MAPTLITSETIFSIAEMAASFAPVPGLEVAVRLVEMVGTWLLSRGRPLSSRAVIPLKLFQIYRSAEEVPLHK